MKYTKLYTKKGNTGTTKLADGMHVSKTHPRIKTVGLVDDLNCAIGQLHHVHLIEPLKDNVECIQKTLIKVMGDIASSQAVEASGFFNKEDLDVIITQIEEVANLLDEKGIEQTDWIIYGKGSKYGLVFDTAGVKCRIAELAVWQLIEEKFEVNKNIAIYFNALSKYLYLCARVMDHQGYWYEGKPSPKIEEFYM